MLTAGGGPNAATPSLAAFGWRGSYATKDEAKKAAQRVFPTATFIEQDELP
jgi:hypothetical protein